MRVEFTFRYQQSDEAANEAFAVPEVTSEYLTSLFNCDGALLRGGELWKPFVQEYRAGSRSFQDWLTSQSEEDWEQFTQQSPGGEAGEDGMFWGPSTPFEPQEAQDWARVWITVLEPLSAQELQILFPLDIDPVTHESRFDKAATINVLRHVMAQAECARRLGARLTVEMALH